MHKQAHSNRDREKALDRERKRQARQNETERQRCKRLAYMRAHNKKRLQLETAQQKV